MNQSYPCPHCGESLEVPPDLVQTPVRCASCQKVFTPGASGTLADDIPLATPTRRRHGVIDDDVYPVRRSRRKLWITLSVIFGVLALACCGGVVYFVNMALHPEWVTYESKEEAFSAKFPGPVSVEQRATGRAGDAMMPAFSAEREMLQEEYEILCVKLLDAEKKKKPTVLMNELADALVAQHAAGKATRPRVERMQDGSDALEFAHKLPGSHHLQARIIHTKERVYVLTVKGPFEPNGSPWVEQFFDSFTATAKDKK